MHHRRHDSAAPQVVDGGWLAGFGVHVGHQRVGGAEVNAHNQLFLLNGAGSEVDGNFSHKK